MHESSNNTSDTMLANSLAGWNTFYGYDQFSALHSCTFMLWLHQKTLQLSKMLSGKLHKFLRGSFWTGWSVFTVGFHTWIGMRVSASWHHVACRIYDCLLYRVTGRTRKILLATGLLYVHGHAHRCATVQVFSTFWQWAPPPNHLGSSASSWIASVGGKDERLVQMQLVCHLTTPVTT